MKKYQPKISENRKVRDVLLKESVAIRRELKELIDYYKSLNTSDFENYKELENMILNNERVSYKLSDFNKKISDALLTGDY